VIIPTEQSELMTEKDNTERLVAFEMSMSSERLFDNRLDL
jgi:hypothetical protein